MSGFRMFTVAHAPHMARLPGEAPPVTLPPRAPGVEPWSPRQRFGNAARMSLHVLDGPLPPDPPLPDLAPALAVLPEQAPAVVLDEPAALGLVERVAQRLHLDAEADEPWPPVAHGGGVEPDWTSDAWSKTAAEGLLWLDETDPVAAGRRRRWRVLAGAAAVLVLAAGAAAALIVPARMANPVLTTGLYNAPTQVLRAGGAGTVDDVLVTEGQAVQPDTVLMRLRSRPVPDGAMAAAQARLQAAHTQLQAAENAMAQAAGGADPGGARVLEVRQQRMAAAMEVAAAQEAADRIAASAPALRPVMAGVHGVVRGLEVRRGMEIAAGTPLARLLDCGKAFLTMPPDAPVAAGQAVELHFAGQKPVTSLVRPSSGGAEPPDSLVVPLNADAADGACPVGTSVPISRGEKAAAISPGRDSST